MKWEYFCTQPDLPQGATSPMMDSRQMTNWLDDMDKYGWELVGVGTKRWHDASTQEWWIFRRLREEKKK